VVAHDPWFELEPNTESQYGNMDLAPMRYFGIMEKMPSKSLEPKKLRLFLHLQYLWSLYDVLDICIFVGVPEYRMISIEQIVKNVNTVTGWDMSVWEAIKIGEKALQLAKLFNTRQGMGRENDSLPDRMFEPLANGAYKGSFVDKTEFESSISTYYEMMGWDKEGIPTLGKFVELGLEEYHMQ
ncbi:MAG TPA: aldehyde ferredoxin oxidoreductase C-terminal domain-containing protein, partial [Anaerovoracaceae bacterium]|nr:aldehyde ferredoxin oxidoreductase C-terminal domain-containing protein [Anaerovoracaceae bacterium]